MASVSLPAGRTSPRNRLWPCFRKWTKQMMERFHLSSRPLIPPQKNLKRRRKTYSSASTEEEYVCSASPYLGKDPSDQKGERLAENVVMKLMEPDDGRNVTMDNFFTSLSLSHRLLQRKATLRGTVNKVWRELPQLARMYSVRAATRRWPVAVFYNMLDLAAVNAYILYKACTGWTGSLLAQKLRCRFIQHKETLAQMQTAAAAVPGTVKTTQCQVQESCNRNRSRFTCATCQKFTCAKCRDDGHWVCKRRKV